MSEKYIPLSGIKSIFRECLNSDEVYVMEQLINCVTPADVAPVVRGHWINEYYHRGGRRANCSRCGTDSKLFKFCPDCGAKMDEEVQGI